MREQQKISPCLWFAGNPDQAAAYYVSVFPNSEITKVHEAPMDWPGGEAGDTVLIELTLAGQSFQILNGGPSDATFNTAVSLSVSCADQSEVDTIWAALAKDGGEPIMCGWLKDKFGVHWQVVPQAYWRMMRDGTPEQLRRLTEEMYTQTKLDVAKLEAAYNAA